MRRPSLANASLLIAGSYVFSNIAGFVARALMNARFGSGAETDAFAAAFKVPDLLFNLFASGALGSAFIPVFAGMLENAQYTRAWRVAQRVAGTVFGVVGVLAALAAWRAPWLIEAFVMPDAPPEAQLLAANMMRMMLVSTVVFSVSGLLMGVLQSAGSFLAPALAPMLYKFGQIFGVLFLTDVFGVYGAASGVIIGSVLHLAVQLPALRKAYIEKPLIFFEETPGIRNEIREVLGAMPWRMIGSGAVQVNNLVQASLVSGVRGAINSLDTAFATLILPQAVIAQAISTALFPTISAHAARGDKEAFADTLTRAVRVIIALSAPAAAGLIVLGQPIIALLFQRNAFTALDSERAGLALIAYATGLVGHSVLEIVTRAFYALKDNKPPVLLGVGSVAANIALSVALLPIAARYTPHAFVAVALANAIATTLEAIVLYGWLARREAALKLGGVWIALGKSALASIVMGAVLLAFRDFAPPGVLSTLAALLIGGAVYFAALFALRSEELAYGVRLVLRQKGSEGA